MDKFTALRVFTRVVDHASVRERPAFVLQQFRRFLG